MGHDLISALVDLLVWLQRGFVEFGSVKILDPVWSSFVYLTGLLSLPFAAGRQFRARRWALAAVLVLLELYFVHNRLTLLSSVQLTRASLVGNLALLGLGLLFIMPISIWARLPKEKK